MNKISIIVGGLVINARHPCSAFAQQPFSVPKLKNNCVWLMQFKLTDLSVLIPTVNEEAIDILIVSFYQFEFSFIRGLHFLFTVVYEFCFRYFTNLIEVLQTLLSRHPVKRPTAAESLYHPFFQVY